MNSIMYTAFTVAAVGPYSPGLGPSCANSGQRDPRLAFLRPLRRAPGGVFARTSAILTKSGSVLAPTSLIAL